MKFAKEKRMSKDLLKELKEQIKNAEEELKVVQESNAKLQDELESLWSMMDELKEADIKNWGHLVKQLQDELISKSLMTTTKKADC
jgi:septal ring factor EnvC (AmiA/AmiB activator)